VGLGRTENRAWKGQQRAGRPRIGRRARGEGGGFTEHAATWGCVEGGVSDAPKAAYDGEDDGRKGTERRGGAATDWPPSKRGEGRLYTLCGHTGAARRAVHIAIKMGQREAGGGGGGERRPVGVMCWEWLNVGQLRLWRPQESDEGEAQGGPIGEWQWRWRRRGRTWLSAIVSGTYIHTAAAAAVRFEFLDKASDGNQQTVGANWAEGTSAVATPQPRRGKDGRKSQSHGRGAAKAGRASFRRREPHQQRSRSRGTEKRWVAV